jgi:para-nitrobenzyl esterase
MIVGASAPEPVAETSLGPVRGRRAGGVAVFAGIPYAAPPVAGLRFAPPAPRERWLGVRDATRPAPAAPQPPSRLVQVVGPMRFEQAEDCLTVNVSTPDLGGRLPVLVWLHGGAFVSGAGGQDWYAAERLAALGIVVVSVTYRLGALGFLYLGDAAEAMGGGNFGLLDQLAALTWVRENVAAFGGDRDQVTIAGQSAGALSALALSTSRRGQGLFRRLILQSLPGGMTPFAPAQAARVAEVFLGELGLGSGAVSRLRTLPVEEILAAQLRVIPRTVRFMELTPPFQLVADDELVVPDLIGQGTRSLAEVDVLIGTTRDETRAWYALDPAVQALSGDGAARVAADLLGEDGPRTYAALAAARPGDAPAEVLGDLVREWYFGAGTLRLAQAAARGYVYRFDWHRAGPLGACHCIELPFLFGDLHPWREAPMLAGADALPAGLVSAVQGAWAAFVRTGDPSCARLPDWRPYTGGQSVLVLDDRPPA